MLLLHIGYSIFDMVRLKSRMPPRRSSIRPLRCMGQSSRDSALRFIPGCCAMRSRVSPAQTMFPVRSGYTAMDIVF